MIWDVGRDESSVWLGFRSRVPDADAGVALYVRPTPAPDTRARNATARRRRPNSR
ncbi:hypothetical protein J2S49_001313 [Arcanobacterium wilhelmae]|uniref:Uncharacterized protein n=1 Tax=Arcanobacterium wilhelmae TaxID=1803177 RepID=A0ABT9NBZ1_9ACTO|nr:hypothetical protein [Arcanobacterium wilhelmae]MDP9801237.1 hypothetical protein [Arcanobacterium wilhelmae]WFN90587.1 hypothetical protein P8A24_01635 [Arcanobacterium wilhelmae]